MVAGTVKSNEEKLKILLEWKKTYTEAIIKALNPTGSVLEVGFGTGTAAELIEAHHPKSHTIILSNPQMVNDANAWAKKYPHTKIIQGDPKSALDDLGSFDAIFYNDFPLDHEMSIMNFLFPEENVEAVDKVKDLLAFLEEQIPQLKMQFSDQDVEDFYQKIGQFNSKELPKFFKKLQNNGNISEQQFNNAAKKYHFAEIEEMAKKTQAQSPKDNMLLFLQECLQKHLNKGGQFSSFLNHQTSKYEDSQFYDEIITNPNVNYKEILLPIKLSDKEREALVMIVEKSV